METTVTLTFQNLYDTVERSLAVIGKRATDENGKSLFGDITVGTNEKQIFNDYFRQAATDLTVEATAFITWVTEDSVKLAFPDNHNAALDSVIQRACNDYCVAFALFSWFTVTAPKIAEKYLADAQRQVIALRQMIYNKVKPAASGLPAGIPSGSVSD